MIFLYKRIDTSKIVTSKLDIHAIFKKNILLF